MKTWGIGMAAVVVVLLLGGSIIGLRGQIDGLQARDGALQAQMTRGRAELARATQVIGAQQAKLSGQHRDLLTCGDLSGIQSNMQFSAVDLTYGDNIAVSTSGTPWLPAHCINR